MSTRGSERENSAETRSPLIDPDLAEIIGGLQNPNHQRVLGHLLKEWCAYPPEIAVKLKLSPDTVIFPKWAFDKTRRKTAGIEWSYKQSKNENVRKINLLSVT